MEFALSGRLPLEQPTNPPTVSSTAASPIVEPAAARLPIVLWCIRMCVPFEGAFTLPDANAGNKSRNQTATPVDCSRTEPVRQFKP